MKIITIYTEKFASERSVQKSSLVKKYRHMTMNPVVEWYGNYAPSIHWGHGFRSCGNQFSVWCTTPLQSRWFSMSALDPLPNSPWVSDWFPLINSTSIVTKNNILMQEGTPYFPKVCSNRLIVKTTLLFPHRPNFKIEMDLILTPNSYFCVFFIFFLSRLTIGH